MTYPSSKFNKKLFIKGLQGDPTLCERLQELGFLKGEHFEIVKAFAFGDPYLIKINHLFVALRKRELECILI